MGYRSLAQCVKDLEKHDRLLRIEDEVDPVLEMAEIQRRVYDSGGPAVLFTNIRGCTFPAVSNLFGTLERSHFLFRDTIEKVRKLIELKIDPGVAAKNPLRYATAPLTALTMLPKFVRRGATIKNETTISSLPQIKCWPQDGGAFVLLPQVFSEDVTLPGWKNSNLGMYRVQLGGNDYVPDREIGLHYQIHRSIGVHHQKAIAAGKPFPVNIFVGGSPAMTLAAVMPLPEGLSELTFAGALAGHRIPLVRRKNGIPVYGDADFAICATVEGKKLEGPFGDHLGYYSLQHNFPCLAVDKVYHRDDAIWPFTVVGRPPQEDTSFGELIHDLTGPIIPTVIPGVKEVNAVDAAGVHPLLLAVGSERYTPYDKLERPQELLTQASAILGQGQLSLAKVLVIATAEPAENLSVHHIAEFFQFVLARFNPTRDLHFFTETTIDTLDYSGSGLNAGSKLVLAACGPPQRELPSELPGNLTLPAGLRNPRVCMPGVLAVEGPKYQPPTDVAADADPFLADITSQLDAAHPLNAFPLVLLVDDSDFASRSLNNWLWVTFTRIDPARDVQGVGSFTKNKHWGCTGSLCLDARLKPRHPDPVEVDAETLKKVDARAAKGGALAKWL